MSEELQLELAKFFVAAWEWYVDNPTEELQDLIEGSDLLEQIIATQEDVDKNIAPEGCEEGDIFYTLSALGHEAWNLAKGKEE